MKFYSVAISVIAIIVAAVASIFTAWQGLYFRSFLLALFIVMQCDILSIRMMVENAKADPLNGLRK